MRILFFLLSFCVFVLIAIQLSLNTFLLGVYVLFFCLLISLFLGVLNMLWYAFIFFLIYVGGVLVLFFYIISLNPNPKFREFFSYTKILYFLFFLCIFFFYCLFVENFNYYFLFFFSRVFEDKSFLLFCSVNVYFLFLVRLYLVYILFVVSYIRRSVKRALRPIMSV